MKRTTALSAAALAALAFAASLQAHHSGFMYETTPVWVKGTVLRFEGKKPHTITTLDDRSEHGRVRRWAVEGPPQWLDRRDFEFFAPKVGDVIEFCAFPYREEHRRPWQDSDGSPLQVVAGHVMVMPDGKKQFWEPHGTIIECIRSSDDQRQSWLDFLNSNPSVRDSWCGQRTRASIQSTESLRTLVEEINSLIANPCK